jgi:hypothetical protein
MGLVGQIFQPRRLGWGLQFKFGGQLFRFGLQGLFDFAKAGLDPAGIAVEGLDVAALPEDPFGGDLLVSMAVFETGVEQSSFALLVEDAMAVEHPPVVVEGAARGIGDGLRSLLGAVSEMGLNVGRHAVDAGVGSGTAAVGGDDGFAGFGAGAGGFAGVGPVGREALLGDVLEGHGWILCLWFRSSRIELCPVLIRCA